MMSPALRDLSRDAKYYALVNSKDEISVWSIPEQRAVVTGWKLPGADKKRHNNPGGLYCLEGGRLLTVTGAGRVRAFQLPDLKPLYDVPPAPQAQFSIPLGPSAGLGLSADRKRLAVFTGNAFQVLDTATGKVMVTTGAFGDLKNVQARGVAFSPSGKELAAIVHLGGAKETVLVRYDLTSGDLTESTPLGKILDPFAHASARPVWVEEHTIVFVTHPRQSSYLVNTQKWEPAGRLFPGQGSAHTVNPGSPRLWCAAADSTGRTGWLIALRFPAAPDPADGKTVYRLTPWGLMQ
jgi:hypothetical protein